VLRKAVGWSITRRIQLPAGWSMAVPVVFAAAGLLATTSAQIARGTDLRIDGRRSTAEVISQQQSRAVEDQNQVAKLRRAVADLNRQAAPTGSRLASVNRAIARLAPAAGLTAVVGPALQVELDDGPNQALPPGVSPDELVVHQQDVQSVVNALWSAGAEAMMLMDQRVIATSAVHCVGNVLILQGRVYSPPYRIVALGNVAVMQNTLDQSPAIAVYRQYVDRIGLGYKVSPISAQTFPAFKGSIVLRHAIASPKTP
jgi:uncharacterized protein YlxW (UPF0749 family)